MASAKDLKKRISSINNTSKITKAMEMVSAAKMQKAQSQVAAAIPYAEGVYQLVNNLNQVSDYYHPFLEQHLPVKKIVIVVIGTSRGFVGGLISRLTAETYQLSRELKQKYPEAEISGISIHKTAQRVINNAGIPNQYHFAKFVEQPNTTDISAILQLLEQGYANKDFDQIHLVYTHFINTMEQEARTKKLLPLGIEFRQKDKKENNQNRYIKYEPDPKTVLDFLLPEYFQTQAYTALLEAIASEFSARMVAMKKATDNANDLKDNIRLQYNKERQATITAELIDIVNGSLSI